MGTSTGVTVGCAVGIPIGIVFIIVLIFWIRANKKYKKELEHDEEIDGFKFDNNNDLDLDDIIDTTTNSNGLHNNNNNNNSSSNNTGSAKTIFITPNTNNNNSNQTDSDKSNSHIPNNTSTTTNNVNSSSSDGNNSFNYDIENNTVSNNNNITNNNTYIKPKRNNTFKKPSKIMGLKLQKNDPNNNQSTSPSYQNSTNILNSVNNSSIFNSLDNTNNNNNNTNNGNTPFEYKNFYESVIPILPSSSTLTSSQQLNSDLLPKLQNSNNNSSSNFLQQPFSTTNSTPKSMKMDQYFNNTPSQNDESPPITDSRNPHLSIQQQQQQDYIRQLHKNDSSSFPITTQTLAIASPSKINLINNYPKIISPGGSFSGLPSPSNVSRSGSSLNLLNNNNNTTTDASGQGSNVIQQTEPTTPLKKSSDQLLKTPINLSNKSLSNSISNESLDPKLPPVNFNDKSPFDTPPRSSQIYQDDAESLDHTDDNDIDIDVEKNKDNHNSNRKSWLRSLTKP